VRVGVFFVEQKIFSARIDRMLLFCKMACFDYMVSAKLAAISIELGFAGQGNQLKTAFDV
jgi:hypothetical protein